MFINENKILKFAFKISNMLLIFDILKKGHKS